jgi:CxxC motif-containing protein (DUF1111 family)
MKSRHTEFSVKNFNSEEEPIMQWLQAGWMSWLRNGTAMSIALLSLNFGVCQLCGDELAIDGKEVFLRDWSKHWVFNAALTGADGLGPLYNAVSCVACHAQGGIGGAGDNEHNVRLLTVTTAMVPQAQATQRVNVKDLKNSPLHPGLKSTSSVVLHRFSVHEQYADMLSTWLQRPEIEPIGMLKGLEELGITSSVASRLHNMSKPGFKPVLAYVRSERNTPSLFGLGQIDGISQKSLVQLSIDQHALYPEVSGKVAPHGGKFGWRGQTSSVKNFVLGACANELGLQTRGFPQPKDPAEFTEPEQQNFGVEHTAKSIDMTDEEISALVWFVNELPPPAEVSPASAEERYDLAQGKSHFASVRCDGCHVKQIDNVVGIYSDLLLHNMGEKLNDPAALAPPSGSRGLSQYYGTGESLLVSNGRKQEWRTPPLWGIRDSAPYLHDGSAATIEDAILAHGGEAAKSLQSFEALTPRQRRELIFFVKSLGAPEPYRTVASSN